ncbi:hypothetical protein L596_000762 [Steinernema carpocapsae]|uniref:Uncharacterized protein n=1 Tax=Steinernema carpocapsae TaxID=34508 RepID=A0A4U8ULI2_STECR|nr:hypothetical protein L596_000762 [Steinernema carpocapsae]
MVSRRRCSRPSPVGFILSSPDRSALSLNNILHGFSCLGRLLCHLNAHRHCRYLLCTRVHVIRDAGRDFEF